MCFNTTSELAIPKIKIHFYGAKTLHVVDSQCTVYRKLGLHAFKTGDTLGLGRELMPESKEINFMGPSPSSNKQTMEE